MRELSMVVAALAMAGFQSAAGAGPALVFHGTPSARAILHVVPDEILYDQTANDSGNAILSQNFEASLDNYDAQAAEDFTIRAGDLWQISFVDVIGQYFNGPGPAPTVNVYFYKNDAHRHMPGPILQRGQYLGVVPIDNGGSFSIKLKPPLKLKAGTWWVSVQANMDFSEGGEWGWENQTTTEGNPAAWVNPNDGLGTGCTIFEPEVTCIPESPGDHMVRLRGVRL